MACRSMSPVDRCGTPHCLATRFDWVPLPAPGGPRKMYARLRGMLTAPSAATAPHPTALADKAFVVAHDELRFERLHCIHRHAHDNQERGAAKIKRHAQSIENGA